MGRTGVPQNRRIPGTGIYYTSHQAITRARIRRTSAANLGSAAIDRACDRTIIFVLIGVGHCASYRSFGTVANSK